MRVRVCMYTWEYVNGYRRMNGWMNESLCDDVAGGSVMGHYVITMCRSCCHHLGSYPRESRKYVQVQLPSMVTAGTDGRLLGACGSVVMYRITGDHSVLFFPRCAF